MSRDSIRQRVEAAHQHVSDLCSGKARWTMRVPAEPDRDSDLVISAALMDADRLLAVADAAADTLADLKVFKALVTPYLIAMGRPPADEPDPTAPAVRLAAALAALDNTP